jgi:phospholipid-binding lipoprotein MlaA
MKNKRRVFLLASLMWLLAAGSSWADGGADLVPYAFSQEFRGRPLLTQASPAAKETENDIAPQEEMLLDPLEPINRAFFEFNDKLYFYVLKPVAIGYRFVLPEKLRVGISNVFRNLAFPVRFVNCLFQGKLEGASVELGSFLLNSIAGMGGFFDIAGAAGVRKYDEDLGQSLAIAGFGPGFYINWPLLGPSTLRGTFGAVGDAFLDPIWYLESSGARWGTRAVNTVNTTSLNIGDYESLKKAALDPYVALRDAYYQNRLKRIKE